MSKPKDDWEEMTRVHKIPRSIPCSGIIIMLLIVLVVLIISRMGAF